MDEQRIEHTATAEAAVNAPAWVTLYDDEGHALQVDAADQHVWLARGFRASRRDAKAALKDLPALWRAAHEALKAAVAQTTDDGVLDTAEAAAYHTARVALVELSRGIEAVLDGLHAMPVKQD